MKGPSFIDISRSFAHVIISSLTWFTYLLVSLELKYLPVRTDRESFIQTLVTESKGLTLASSGSLLEKQNLRAPTSQTYWFRFCISARCSDDSCSHQCLTSSAVHPPWSCQLLGSDKNERQLPRWPSTAANISVREKCFINKMYLPRTDKYSARQGLPESEISLLWAHSEHSFEALVS